MVCVEKWSIDETHRCEIVNQLWHCGHAYYALVWGLCACDIKLANYSGLTRPVHLKTLFSHSPMILWHFLFNCETLFGIERYLISMCHVIKLYCSENRK